MDMTQYAGKESNYLKAADLNGSTPTVKIAGVELVEFENDGKKEQKPALILDGKQKKLVLNATNTENLIRKYGAQSEGWIGKDLMLSTQYYQAFDREGLVVTALDTSMDDDIPF
jgi:hypothetical protein